MLRSGSKRLVIDASIAAAAGGLGEKPVCKPFRDLLQAILSICHHMVLTPEISDEWRRHQGPFATRWRRYMYGMKKVCASGAAPDPTFRERVRRAAQSERDAEAMAKDVRLIEAALATDRVVLSRDVEARQLLAAAAEEVPELREVGWVVPSEGNIDEVIRWMKAGAKPRREWLLGHNTGHSPNL